MILLPPDVLARVRSRNVLIMQYQLLISDLQAGVEREFAALGVDVNDGDWSLDLDRGLLERKDTPDDHHDKA